MRFRRRGKIAIGLVTALAALGSFAVVESHVLDDDRVETAADRVVLVKGFEWSTATAGTGFAGDVVVRDGCYLLKDSADKKSTVLPIWPVGTRLSDDGSTIRSAGSELADGSRFSGGISVAVSLDQDFSAHVPERCSGFTPAFVYFE